ncbi:MAG: HAMP domain-containing sensor histidine kinase [Bermanella sp.]
MANESLLHYLRNRLLLLGLVLASLFSMVMYAVYNWGLDDASEYYLLQDARYAESLLLKQSPWPNNSFNKQYYFGSESLPDSYLSSLKKDTYPTGGPIQYFAVNVGDDFFYGIRYQIKAATDIAPDVSSKESIKEKQLYVVHGFHLLEDETLPGVSIFEVSLMVLLVVLIVMVTGALLIYSNVSKAMQALKRFSDDQQLSPTEASPHNDDVRLFARMRYIEVRDVAEKLKEALQCINSQAQKERAFIQCLSHELRTPMAITGVALDLLNKQSFDAKTQQKLQKIRLANNDMITLANTLRSIWDNEKKHAMEDVEILPIVEGVIENISNLFLRDDVRFELDISQKLTMNICLLHFKIILENLCKNALQYSATGVINIRVDSVSLNVRNNIFNAGTFNGNEGGVGLAESHLQQGYGYGLGLYIAQQAALNQGWDFIINDGGDKKIKNL